MVVVVVVEENEIFEGMGEKKREIKGREPLKQFFSFKNVDSCVFIHQRHVNMTTVPTVKKKK